jgi:hypothetical protein
MWLWKLNFKHPVINKRIISKGILRKLCDLAQDMIQQCVFNTLMSPLLCKFFCFVSSLLLLKLYSIVDRPARS